MDRAFDFPLKHSIASLNQLLDRATFDKIYERDAGALMPKCTMYRVNVFETQRNLFSQYPGASSILEKIVNSAPRRTLKTRSWLIGNVQEISKGVLYFRFGRERSLKKTVWLDDHFDDVEDKDMPYCHIFINTDIEYFSISHNPRVGSSIPSIVRQLHSLFRETEEAKQFSLEFEFRPIKNPTDFIDRLKAAKIVRRFWFTVARPNVADAGQATRDLERFTKDMGGRKAKTQIEGNAINIESAVQLSKVAASNGQDAGASFRERRATRWTRTSIGKNNIEYVESDEALKNDQVRIVSDMAALYRKTRGQ